MLTVIVALIVGVVLYLILKTVIKLALVGACIYVAYIALQHFNVLG